MNHLTIGAVARLAGVHVETIRYYERRGLLARPPRSASNYRLYSEDAVRRVRFVKRAQELGFTLREVGELLALRATPGALATDVRQRVHAKIEDIDAKIAALRAMRRSLAGLARRCCSERSVSACPILASLDGRR